MTLATPNTTNHGDVDSISMNVIVSNRILYGGSRGSEVLVIS